MDNTTNNDTLVEHFALRCRQEGVDFDAGNARMRCLPHTIHLAALKVDFYPQRLVDWHLSFFH